MNSDIENIKKTRAFLLNVISGLSVAQLNKVPAGFNNNIIWNLGHLIAAQQNICYLRAGATPVVDEKYLALYKSGTRPEQEVDENELEKIVTMLSSSLDRLVTDRATGIFNQYIPWSTRYGIAITSVEDAIAFLPYHEGVHAGTILALKKLVSV